MVGKKVTAFDVVLVVIMVLLSAMFLYPLLNMLALSFSAGAEVPAGVSVAQGLLAGVL